MKKLITIILIISLFPLSTCTTDNTITGNQELTIGKPVGGFEGTGDDDPPYGSLDDKWRLNDDQIVRLAWLVEYGLSKKQLEMCFFFLTGFIMGNSDKKSDNLSLPYDFRDNYLSISEKGKVYTVCYYLLSEYGIDNNLVNKYYKEHYKLLKSSVIIAYNLQHGNNNNQILINHEFHYDLKDIVKIYRSHPNHNDIEPVLQYLEADLEKYYNKPKYEIAIDFQQN